MVSRLDQRLDRLEQIVLAGIYLFFAYRLLSAGIRDHSLFDFIYLFDQTIVILFLMMRRSSSRITENPTDWAAAFLGTTMPLLAEPSSSAALLPASACLTIYLVGALLHIYSKLSLRRSFGAVPAHRGLKHEGPYRFIRHPMYLGYIISQFAFLLSGPTLWNIFVLGASWAVQIWRIENEERFLVLDENYRIYQTRVRYRIVPWLY